MLRKNPNQTPSAGGRSVVVFLTRAQAYLLIIFHDYEVITVKHIHLLYECVSVYTGTF
jgi:hypothetical protein